MIGPEARFVLTRDGHVRFGLGKPASLKGVNEDDSNDALQFAAVERVIDGS